METLQPKKKHGCLMSAVVVIAAIAIIGGIVSTISPPAQTAAASGPSAASIARPAAASSKQEDAPVKIGAAVDNGKVSIKINFVKEMDKINDGYLSYSPDTGGKFVVVNLTAKNTGKELYSFVVNNFQIEASDGKQYSPNTIFTAGSDYLNSGSMNPGLSQTGYIAFEVPKEIKLSTLTLEFQEFLSFNKADFSLSK